MAHALTQSTKELLEFLAANEGKDYTAQDLANELGYEDKRKIDGMVTSGLIGREPNKKNYVERVSGGFVQTDKGVKEVKYIKITEAGKAYDHDAAIAADIAEKTAKAAKAE